MRVLLAVVALGLALGFESSALAQTSLPMGGLSVDPNAPIEFESDALEVSQTDGAAVFKGNVLIVQADMRLTAEEVRVSYLRPDDGSEARISQITATGAVTLVSGTEQAEAETAVYDVDAGTIRMSGNVLLTQGPTIVSGESLLVTLATGTGVMEGRVRTVINPGNGAGAARN